MSNVIIYTTPTCGFCKMAKDYFDDNDISYETKDVTTNPDAYNEILEKSGQLGTPVIDIDGEVIIGFDQPKIDKAIKKG